MNHNRGGNMGIIIVYGGQGRQDITESNFWNSEWNAKGIIACSVNSGAFQLLLPDSVVRKLGGVKHTVEEMESGKEIMVLKGKERFGFNAYRFVFDDHTLTPFMFQLGANQMLINVSDGEDGRTCRLSVWIRKPGSTSEPLKIYDHAAVFKVVDTVEVY